MSFDCYGKLVPAIATSWEANEDAYTTAQYEEFAKAFDAAKS